MLGSWWAALLLVCTTIMCLTSAFTAFILYVRPVLQVCPPLHISPAMKVNACIRGMRGNASQTLTCWMKSARRGVHAENRASRSGL